MLNHQKRTSMKNYIVLLLTTLFPLSIVAQTATQDSINRKVTVESVYNPVLTSSEKRMFLPEEEQQEIEKSAAVYAEDVENIRQFSRTPLFAKGVKVEEATNYPGYLRIGAGSRWNADAQAAFHHNLGRHNAIDLWISHDGFKGTVPYEEMKWKGMLYNLETAFGFTHKGEKGPTVKAGIDSEWHTYNYIVTNSQQAVTERQHARYLGGAAAIEGNWPELSPGHAATYRTGVDFHQWHQKAWLAADEPVNEDHLSVNLGSSVETGVQSVADLDITSDVMFYNNQGGYHDYFSLSLNPTWRVNKSFWAFKAGLHLDFQFDDDRPAQVAPDFRLSFKPLDFMRLSLSADGGRNVRTFKDLYRISPWWGSTEQLRQSYDVLNAHLQLDARIVDGVHVGAWGGYRIAKDEIFATPLESNGLLYTGLVNQDANVWNMGANVVASWKDVVTLTTSVDYFSWHTETNVLDYAPEEDMKMNARVHVMEKLYADATLRYVRFTSANGERKPSVVDLGIGAQYAVLDNVSAFAKIENLLNRHSGLTPVYPQQGIYALVGASLKF